MASPFAILLSRSAPAAASAEASLSKVARTSVLLPMKVSLQMDSSGSPAGLCDENTSRPRDRHPVRMNNQSRLVLLVQQAGEPLLELRSTQPPLIECFQQQPHEST